MADSIFDGNFKGVPGFGVQPSDEQLVNFYLKNKMQGSESYEVNIFPTVDVSMHDPWDLIEHSFLKNQPWHFYSYPKKKYTNSNRADRTTKSGYWKVTGKDYIIMDEDDRKQNGFKKILVFHEGRFPNGKKTGWVMHEYHPTFSFPNQMDLVLCKVKNNDENGSSYETGSSSQKYDSLSIEDQLSTLMSSNEDDSDDPRVQAYMQELGACVGTGDYNVENTFQPYNSHHRESSPYFDGTYNRWP